MVSVEGKGMAKTVSGEVQGDERKRTTDEVSKTSSDDVETGGVHHSRIGPGENLSTAWATSGIKVAGAADKAAIQRVRIPPC